MYMESPTFRARELHRLELLEKAAAHREELHAMKSSRANAQQLAVVARPTLAIAVGNAKAVLQRLLRHGNMNGVPPMRHRTRAFLTGLLD